MGKVVAEISMSVDGVVAGPGTNTDHRLGRDGELLHGWMAHGDETDHDVMAGFFKNTGAFVLGRTTFDMGIDMWGPDGAFERPSFVLTHRAAEPLERGKTTFTFVTDGPETALAQARSAAGELDVVVMSGSAIKQLLSLGLVDELRLHVVPLLFGAGVRLFDDLADQRVALERTDAITTPTMTHLTYRIAS
ncbi:dihydrofolate reductase family protein [Amycolatopsis rhabdoformis]|uniref:Dihydrofolate reductase family protein n=1 Tax=Amycolatopsis rhabdoformis TaxID=1448059 RepID=A0ABZ1HZU5_9PSEU|nr:dihydrofolate reductase family protein [Amycolatopsis rhabdoformis]WSE27661.1 dihydrofolate reductase family protein [Amycolatopsis rhabdoformis]